ncbi:MAG TPA: hypothetical protein VIL37_18280 [Natronosporangium sp.]
MTRERLPEPLPTPESVAARPSRTARRLTWALAVLLGLGLFAGVAGVTSVQDRSALVDEIATRDGPLVVAAQDLYRSLSDADATAASAFLTEGPEPVALRERYQADIARASAALTTVASGAATTRATAPVITVLQVQLPVYTGLVETARAYNRLGLPVGAAYLREASALMRDTLLPAAESLFEIVSDELADARGSAARLPWFALLLGVALLAALVVVQRMLTRRTNRLFNLWLVLATVAAFASTLWLAGSWWSAASHLDASHRDGSAQVALLSQARITALQARSSEALTLVARGAGAEYERNFTAAMTELMGEGGLLAAARDEAADGRGFESAEAAIAAANEWQQIHAEVRRLDETAGDYPAAVALAIGPDEQSAGSAFERLDSALGDGITHGNQRFAAEAAQAGDALSAVAPGVGLLTALALAGIAIGIQQRLREYR